MDICSGAGYPASALSNFSPHAFEFDGVRCASMEGLLQAFKTKYTEVQKHICTLVGKQAKFAGKKHKWWKYQKLFWLGKEYARESEEYQQLLWRAYLVMAAQNQGFRRALLASGNAVLRHSIGKNDPKHTVLTEREFCGILTRLRDMLRRGVLNKCSTQSS